jgi:hypothetical protein
MKIDRTLATTRNEVHHSAVTGSVNAPHDLRALPDRLHARHLPRAARDHGLCGEVHAGDGR